MNHFLRLQTATFLLCFFLPFFGQSQIANRSGHDTTIFISNTVFVPKFAYESGQENWAVDVADMNHDGKIDAVTCSQKDSKVNVHINDGRGRFSKKSSYTCGKTPRDLCIGDFNGDKHPDVAVVSIGDQALTWLLNDGRGHLKPMKSIVTGPNPHNIKCGDMNGDGKLDIVTVTNGNGMVNVHFGDGDGNFTGAASIATGYMPRSIGLGDIDGDGKLDVLVGADDRSINIHLNDGTGKLKAKIVINSAESIWGVQVCDVNGDGKMDFVGTSYSLNQIAIHVQEQYKKMVFKQPQYVGTGDKPFDLIVRDFDQDGDSDVVTASTRDMVINFHLNDGTGTMGKTQPISSGNWNSAIAAADFDGDGDPDIATSSIKDNMLNIHRNRSIYPDGTPNSACVYGVVKDKDSGLPVVSIVSIVSSDGTTTAAIKTNSKGEYRMCEIPFGENYSLKVKAKDYPLYQELFALNNSHVKDGLEKNVTLEKIKNTDLFGTVKDLESGAPLVGATIVVKDSKGALLAELTSGADGSYRKNLPFGVNYEVTASFPEYNTKTAQVSLYPSDYPVGVRRDFDLQKTPKTKGCVQGFVLNEKTLEKIPGAEVRILDADGNTIEKLTSDAAGQYKSCLPFGVYYLQSVKKGYMFAIDSFKVGLEHAETPLEKDIKLLKFEKGMKIILKNIYYDVAKATLRAESKAELDRLIRIMNENPTLVVEIGGHTDSDGSDSYNQTLSQNRSQSVVDYLIDAGVPEERMEAKGYGEVQPIAPNDTKENKQLNRRTEFIVLDF